MANTVVLTPLANLQNQLTAVNTINNNNATVTAALLNTLALNGSQPNSMQANLDMNSNHLLNLPAATSQNEPLRLQDLANFTTNGTVSLNPLPTGGTTGQILAKNSNANFDFNWSSTLPSNINLINPNITGTVTGAATYNTPTLSAPVISTITNTGTLTLPTSTDTLVGRSTTDTLINKTISGASNTLSNVNLASQVTGNLPVANLAGGSGATSSTFWRGDGTWNAPPAGVITLIETLSPSGVASATTTQPWTGFNIIDIVYYNLIPVTTSVTCQLQVHSSGSYQTTSYSNTFYIFSTTAVAQGGSTTGMLLTCGTSMVNTATLGLSGTLRIYNPNSTTLDKAMTGMSFIPITGGLDTGGYSGTWTGGVTALDGAQILFSSGNISSGTIKIYGYT